MALDDAFSDHRGSGFWFPHEGDLEKARYAREGSIKFVPDSFADMEIHSDFVADAHAISKCSAVVECFESEYWIVFKRKYAGREADLDFSVRVHGFLSEKCWKLPYHLNIVESTVWCSKSRTVRPAVFCLWISARSKDYIRGIIYI